MSIGMSPQRLSDADKISEKLKVPLAEVYAALKERRNVPRFAMEYIRNKNLDIPEEEKYPLWYQYLERLFDDRLY